MTRSARKARGDGHQRRAELLRAAERLFLTEGYEKTTIRRIAEEVGVSSTTIYMYFDDKSQILLQIGASAAGALSSAFDEIEAAGEDPELQVRDMLKAFIRFGRENRYAFQLLFCVASPDVSERRREACTALVSRCYGQLSAALSELRAQGRMRAICPDITAQALWSACHGIVAFPLACPDSLPGSPEDIEALTVEGLLRGLSQPRPFPDRLDPFDPGKKGLSR